MKHLFWALLLSLLVACLYHFTASASPLDDAYIYFQYARMAAHGSFFVYQAGDAPSTGVSGLLYYLILSALAKCGWEGPSVAWSIGALSLFVSAYTWLRLCAKSFPDLPFWVQLGLFFGLGPLVAAHFNGMETGLFFALLLASLEALSSDPPPWRVWPLLALLALSRPEGQVAALLFIPWAYRSRKDLPSILGLLVAIAIPTLILLAVTGSMVPDSVRPKDGPLMATPLATHLGISLHFMWDSLTAFFLNLRGMDATVGQVGNAQAGNPPYVHYLPFSLVLALLGYLMDRRWRPLFYWAFLIWLLLAWDLPVGWNQHRYLNILSPAMLLGVACFLNALGPGLLSRTLALAWILFGIFSGLWFYHRQLTSAFAYQANHGVAAAWLKVHAKAGDRVAVLDSGILAYQSGVPIVDLAGITDHRLAMLADREPRAMVQELYQRPAGERPNLAVLHWERPDFNPQFWVAKGLLKPIVTFTDPQGAHMGIFSFNWSKAPAALN